MKLLGWAAWSSWSTCSNTCGHGLRVRERPCRGQSQSCHGRNKEEETCERGPCTTIPLAGLNYFFAFISIRPRNLTAFIISSNF